MSSDLTTLSAHQLRQAAAIRERIEVLEKQFAALLPPSAEAPVAKRAPKRRFSAAARARMAAAAKARWAKAKAPAKPERRFSAATRAAMSKRLRARWAKAKAAGKKAL